MIHESAYIHPTAVIYDGVVIEENVYVGAYCIIGSPAEWKGREDNTGKVIIKKGSRLTGLVTVDSGTHRVTTIGENCYIMKGAYIAHDSILENNCTISSGVRIGGHCHIAQNCNLGMNAAIHQRVYIPEGCMIGASAFVGKKSNLQPHYKYAGVPVKPLGENK